MLSNEQWKEKQEELDELIELRQVISNRIHILRIEIAQKSKQKEVDKTNTIAWQMFGKRLRDLTATEYREYYNARQRERRKRDKQ